MRSRQLNNELKCGLALVNEARFLETLQELLNQDQIDALEWSFDTSWLESEQDSLAGRMLAEFSERNALLGHGVFFSVLSANLSKRQELWLEKLESECSKLKYVHISEHIGFMESKNYLAGSHMPVPYCQIAVDVARRNLELLAKASSCPIGLENLALAFSPADVLKQGQFLKDILEPVSGFILLDLHNIYCQSVNFSIPALDIISTFPLDLVKQVHLSGGSWQSRSLASDKQMIRRDTHDGPVPEQVIALLEYALANCPNLAYVILERLTLKTSYEQADFISEYESIYKLVRSYVQTS